MAFCSFTKDSIKQSVTAVDNNFILDYLLEADGVAVKVYLYGLYLCKNSQDDIDFSSFCSSLYLDESTVKDCFRYWEEYDCVSIITEEPFTVKYLPLSHGGKPHKVKSGKYDDFNKSLQTLITERMISINEYADYISIMEDYSIKPEAMLMICKYCVDIKGANIGSKYILAVTKDFAMRGIVTAESISIELADYFDKSNDIQGVLSAIGLKRKADVEDLSYYNKWIKDFGFDSKIIKFVCKENKIKSILTLDEVLTELYSAKAFSEKEVKTYLNRKIEVYDLAKNITRELSIYCQVLKPVVDNYINPWSVLGYDDAALLFIAKYCFKKRKQSLEDMNDVVNSLYNKGLVSINDIGSYLKQLTSEDAFIKSLLELTGANRSPNEWDRKNLLTWHNWGFTDEMIIEASKRSAGKSNPMIYMNSILNNWKSKGIFSIQNIPNDTTITNQQYQKTFENQRNYTEEELDALITDIDSANIDL